MSDDAYSPSSGGGFSTAESSPDSQGSFDELNSSDEEAAVEADGIIRSIVPMGADIQAAAAAAAALPVANHNQQPPSSPVAQGQGVRRPSSRSADTQASAQRPRLAPHTPPNGGGGVPEGNGGEGAPRTPPNGGGGVPESNGGDSRVSELNIQFSGMSTGGGSGGANDDADEGNINDAVVVVGAAADGPAAEAAMFDNLVAGVQGVDNPQQLVNEHAVGWQAEIVLNESITINGVVIPAGQSILFSSCFGNYNNLGVGAVGHQQQGYTFSADRNTITKSPVASFTNTGHQVVGITITRQVVRPPVVYQHPTLYPITNNGARAPQMRTVLVRVPGGSPRIIMVIDKTAMLPHIFECRPENIPTQFPNIIIRDYQVADGPARILDEAHDIIPRTDLWMPGRYFPLNRHRDYTSFGITVARVRRAAQRYHDPNMGPMTREVGSGPFRNKHPFHNYELGDDNVDADEDNV